MSSISKCSRASAPLQAGQLLLFLRQHLQLSEAAVLKHFKWAAVLSPTATQDSMQAVTAALQQHLATATSSSSSLADPQQLLPLLQTFPEVLGWDVEADLMPKLRFFEGLGAAGQRLLRGTLWEPDSSWLPGLRSWGYSVAPKLALMADVLGSHEEVWTGLWGYGGRDCCLSTSILAIRTEPNLCCCCRHLKAEIICA